MFESKRICACEEVIHIFSLKSMNIEEMLNQPLLIALTYNITVMNFKHPISNSETQCHSVGTTLSTQERFP